MAQLYLVAVCQGSALDVLTNNYTLFNLIEQTQLAEEVEFPVTLPFEVHSYWSFDPDELHRAHQVRVVLIDEHGNQTVAGEPFGVTPSTPRHRTRMQGLQVPGAAHFWVAVEWRHGEDEEWYRHEPRWPFIVRRGGRSGDR